jgi:hypothetical protein
MTRWNPPEVVFGAVRSAQVELQVIFNCNCVYCGVASRCSMDLLCTSHVLLGPTRLTLVELLYLSKIWPLQFAVRIPKYFSYFSISQYRRHHVSCPRAASREQHLIAPGFFSAAPPFAQSAQLPPRLSSQRRAPSPHTHPLSAHNRSGQFLLFKGDLLATML